MMKYFLVILLVGATFGAQSAQACAKLLKQVVHEGDLAIESLEDLQAAQKYTHIKGWISLNFFQAKVPPPFVVEFPNLVEVQGGITAGGMTLKAFIAPNLVTVTHDISLTSASYPNENLERVEMPLLILTPDTHFKVDLTGADPLKIQGTTEVDPEKVIVNDPVTFGLFQFSW